MDQPSVTPGQLYAALARLRMKGRACDAATDVLTGVCDSLSEAGERHGISRAAVSQAVKRIQAELAREFVTVAVRLPKDKLGELEAWLDSQGGRLAPDQDAREPGQ